MSDVEVCRWTALGAERAALERDLDHIFFSSSARRSFASERERTEFRERWLGRYLTHFPDNTFVALTPQRRAIGYVVGSLADPARDPMFADLAFFAAFRTLTARYPAQLHVNLDPDWRGQRIGAELVDAFADHAREHGAPGVHVVTTRGARNVRFYLARGFAELGTHEENGRALLFLGRDLLAPA